MGFPEQGNYYYFTLPVTGLIVAQARARELADRSACNPEFLRARRFLRGPRCVQARLWRLGWIVSLASAGIMRR